MCRSHWGLSWVFWFIAFNFKPRRLFQFHAIIARHIPVVSRLEFLFVDETFDIEEGGVECVKFLSFFEILSALFWVRNKLNFDITLTSSGCEKFQGILSSKNWTVAEIIHLYIVNSTFISLRWELLNGMKASNLERRF